MCYPAPPHSRAMACGTRAAQEGKGAKIHALPRQAPAWRAGAMGFGIGSKAKARKRGVATAGSIRIGSHCMQFHSHQGESRAVVPVPRAVR